MRTRTDQVSSPRLAALPCPAADPVPAGLQRRDAARRQARQPGSALVHRERRELRGGSPPRGGDPGIARSRTPSPQFLRNSRPAPGAANGTARATTARRAGSSRRCTRRTSTSPAAASTTPHAALVLPAGRRTKGRTASGRRPKRRVGTILSRLWFRLSSLEVRLEERVRRHALARRLLHPVRRLRALAP